MAIGTGEIGTMTATGEARATLGAIRKRVDGRGSRIKARILRWVPGLRRSESTLTHKPRHNSIGVFPADWEYVTSIALRLDLEPWERFVRGGVDGPQKC